MYQINEGKKQRKDKQTPFQLQGVSIRLSTLKNLPRILPVSYSEKKKSPQNHKWDF